MDSVAACNKTATRNKASATVNAGVTLTDAIRQWPTPAARDVKGANSETHCTVTGTGRKHMDQLANFVEHGYSSPVPGWVEMVLSLTFANFSQQTLTELGAALKRSAETRYDGENYSIRCHGLHQASPKKKLNVWFVEALMGLPLDWTAATGSIGCGCVAMA